MPHVRVSFMVEKEVWACAGPWGCPLLRRWERICRCYSLTRLGGHRVTLPEEVTPLSTGQCLKRVSGLGVSVRRRSNWAVRLEGLLKVGVAYQRGHLCFWPVRLGGQVCSLVRKKHERVKKTKKQKNKP